MDEESLHNALVKYFDDGIERYQDKVYGVSEVVLCEAKAYYYRKLNLKPRKNNAMMLGTVMHSLIPKFAKQLFKNPKYEVECVLDLNEFKIVGHADVVDDGKVYEFKFSRASKEKLNSQFPARYLKQGNLYTHILGLKKYAIVVVNPLTFEVVIKEMDYDKTLAENDIWAIEKMNMAIIEDEVPSGPKFDWECKYCDLKEYCINYQRNKK